MDRIADWLVQVGLTQAIFRPFHENTGNWFWWGASACTPAQYRAAWKYTTSYLRGKGVHSLVYAYSPSKPSIDWNRAYGDDPATSRYPGDDEVDIVCFDRYGPGDYSADLSNECQRVVTFATAHNKVPGICETGVRGGIQNEHDPLWYTKSLLRPVLGSCPRVAFVYTWRNGSPNAYWVPLPGQDTYQGFEAFFTDRHTIFADDSRLKWQPPSPPPPWDPLPLQPPSPRLPLPPSWPAPRPPLPERPPSVPRDPILPPIPPPSQPPTKVMRGTMLLSAAAVTVLVALLLIALCRSLCCCFLRRVQLRNPGGAPQKVPTEMVAQKAKNSRVGLKAQVGKTPHRLPSKKNSRSNQTARSTYKGLPTDYDDDDVEAAGKRPTRSNAQGVSGKSKPPRPSRTSEQTRTARVPKARMEGSTGGGAAGRPHLAVQQQDEDCNTVVKTDGATAARMKGRDTDTVEYVL